MSYGSSYSSLSLGNHSLSKSIETASRKSAELLGSRHSKGHACQQQLPLGKHEM